MLRFIDWVQNFIAARKSNFAPRLALRSFSTELKNISANLFLLSNMNQIGTEVVSKGLNSS